MSTKGKYKHSQVKFILIAQASGYRNSVAHWIKHWRFKKKVLCLSPWDPGKPK